MSFEITSPLRLACGPLNQASQGREWVEAVTRQLGVSAFSFAADGSFARLLRRNVLDDRSHVPVPHYRLSPDAWRRWSIQHKLNEITHLLNESNSPILADPRTDSFIGERDWPQARGIRSAIVFHGSEIRDPSLAMELDPHSYFRDAPPGWVGKLAGRVERNRREAEDSGLPTFISTPDLAPHLPSARLLPLTLDVGHWAMNEAFRTSDVPRVLHRPSRSVPPIKGTQHIVPVLRSLRDDGLIEIVESGEVTRGQMKSLLSKADIVVDQIQTGSYGVAAVEAMAAGRLVVGNVSTSARDKLGGVIPIVDANPQTFEEVMRDLLADPQGMRSTAADGVAFAERLHDGRAAAAALSPFLGLSSN